MQEYKLGLQMNVTIIDFYLQTESKKAEETLQDADWVTAMQRRVK